MATVPLPRAFNDAPDGGVFFLHGEDRFQKEEVLRCLIERYVDPATKDFNLDTLRGSEVDVETLASILATPPMMARFRVVVVREVEALASSTKARDTLLGLVSSPPPGLVAVLEATIPERSKAKVYRDLKSSTRSAEFPAISQDDVPGWLIARSREQHDREMEPDAARALAASFGSALGILAKELEKLSGMVDPGVPIAMTQVEAAGTHLPRQDRWKWFDLVGEKQFGEAIAGLGVLLQQGENGVSLTIGLATHLLRLGVLVEDGSQALERVLPPHQKWLARRLQGQARRWSGAEISAAVLGLRRADELLKSSPMGDGHILEQWLLTTMARAQVAA